MRTLARRAADALVARGYEQKDDLLRLRIDAAWSWVVDVGRLDRRDGVAPWLGLRHDGVQRLVAECSGIADSGFVATGGSNVGYILGGDYIIANESGPPESVLRALEAARAVLERCRTLAALPAIWDIKGTKWPTWHFRLAACRFLLADEPGLLAALAVGEREDCRVEDAMCDQFRRFEAAIRARWRDRV